MLWFVLGILITIIVASKNKDFAADFAFGVFLTVLAGGLLNLLVGAWWMGTDEVTVSLDRAPGIEIINQTDHYVFEAGGEKYVAEPSVVEIAIGKPRAVLVTPASPPLWASVIDFSANRETEYRVYINP